MDFSVDFFRDEVRNGFYIPTAIKQAWAANLSVLSEIDRICEKYGIKYFADWGSILGAVRHSGYVPWDDDLDICMIRKDYERFREVADDELPDEFAIHDFRRKENHRLFLTRIVNSNQISFDEKHLRTYHNFPYIAVVDIFIKDYLYRDMEEERTRCDEVKRLIALADGIADCSFHNDVVERELNEIEKRYGVNIDRKLSPIEMGIILYDIAEKQMGRVKEEDADDIGQIFPMVMKGGRGVHKEYYDNIVRLPFENTTVPVPACYDEILRNRYGNYLEIHKIWSGHDYPYFEKQRENLQAVADFKLPEFTISPDMIHNVEKLRDTSGSLKEIADECMNRLNELTSQIGNMIAESTYEDVLSILPECQQLSVDFGTLVEETKGEERISCKLVIPRIQTYCDALYAIYQVITKMVVAGNNSILDLSNEVDNLKIAFQEMHSITQEQIIQKKEVLFLTIGPREWNSFVNLYNRYTADERYDVYVVPLPLLFKDALGQVTANVEEIDRATRKNEYPENIMLTSWTSYNLQMHQPDKIYIHNPYDGENPCLTVPPQYYAKNICAYTNELIYIPPFKVDEFSKDDYNDIYNMKHYVTAPGVLYADAVIVQSDNMKQRYVEKLTELAGEDTREVWQEKIRIENVYIVPERDSTVSKKKIFYCIGLNELSEHKENIIESVKERFGIFADNSDRINVTVAINPIDIGEWRKVDENLSEELFGLIHDYTSIDNNKNNWCRLGQMKLSNYDEIVAIHDAYYGSASPLVPMFIHEKKPVMISGY